MKPNIKINETHQVDIYVGYREHYSDVYHSHDELIQICKKFCDMVELCVSISPIHYVYVAGDEPGGKITLINYPRFPSTLDNMVLTATELGTIIMEKFNQFRISIVADNKTFMLENENFTTEENEE